MKRLQQMRGYRTPLVAALLVLTLSSAASDSAISVHLSPEQNVVFRWASDRCADDDIPDAPARAFRDADGVVHLLAPHYDNRAFTVLNGVPKRLDCRLVLDSPGDADPAHYRDRRWITATWTDDGKTVHALVHHEYQGQRHPGACTFPGYTSCWYNVITYARSDDGGRSFTQSDPPAVVAAPPFRQDVGQGRPRGFFNPTNILKRGAYWYALIQTTGWDEQPAGSCLFRTSDLAKPELWMAWDGQAFATRFGDPYRSGAPAGANATCKPVTPRAFGSMLAIEGTDLTIATFLRESGDAERRSWMLAYSLSSDLITWSAPVDLEPLRYFGSKDCGDTSRYGYPALLDLNTTSRNFDMIGKDAMLFLTRFNVRGCRNSMDRDLVARPIKISPQP